MFFWNRSRFTRVRATRAARGIESVPGTIIIEHANLPCRIRGAAEPGAVIEIEARAPPRLPEHFFLKAETDRTHRRVRLLWQHKRQAGIEFLTTWSVKR